jgi:hypothetical protein
MRNVTDFAVVPNRVRLNAGEVSFREAGRQWILTHQEFIRAVNIIANCLADAQPNPRLALTGPPHPRYIQHQ